MKYRLISLGQLKTGFKEQTALPALMEITKLPELKVRQKLLSGKRVNLLTSPNVSRIAELKGKLQQAGLIIEVTEVEDPVEKPVREVKKARKPFFKIAIATVLSGALAAGVFAGGQINGLW